MKKLLYTFILTAFMTGLSFGQTTILEQDFSAGFGDWTTVSVVGDQEWQIDSIHGVDGSLCAKVQGYDGGAFENEDWLISPAINFDTYENEVLNFQTAMNYTGLALELKISTDYAGDPSTATWEDLSFTASEGSWAWTASGNIDLTSYTGTGYIAYKFMSTTDGSATWEVDNITLTDGEVTPPPTGDAILEQDFEAEFGDWTTYSVTGDQEWEISTYGNPGNCAKMTGYAGEPYENEDWLISPAFNLDDSDNEILTFDVAMNYTGPDMELLISTDYTSGDPTTATWETLSFTHPAGGSWDWNSSGEIDLSSYSGTAVFIAYKFTSTTDGSATWEVDNILLEEGEVIPPTGDVFFEQDFEAGFGDWETISIVGDQEWTIDSIHGVDGSICAKVSGYAGAPFDNEDWLVSPSVDLSNYSDVVFSFFNATSYDGPAMEVFISTDYSGDVSAATWTNLEFTASAGSWDWVNSGNINLSSYEGTINVAFKFTSTTDGSATWEVDNITLSGNALGINDENTTLFNIYPNPNQGNFYVENTSNEDVLFSIYNINGKEVYSSSMNNSLIQLNLDLEAGTYFIQMKDANAKLLGSRKIIIK